MPRNSLVWKLPAFGILSLAAMTCITGSLNAQMFHNLAATELSTTAPLERPAKLVVQDVPLSHALNMLESESGVSLVYSPSRVPKNDVTCRCYSVTVRDALDEILGNSGFHYSQHNGQVVIESNPPQTRFLQPPQAKLASNVGQENSFGLRMNPLVENSSGAFEVAEESAPNPAELSTNSAQGTLTGLVTDVDTQQPLSGVQIYISAIELATLTQANGRFILLNVPTGTHTLTAQRIGYQTVSETAIVTEGETSTVAFELAQRALDLEGIIVSLSAADTRRVEMGTDVGILNVADQIEGAAITSASDMLNSRIPGVQISETTGEVGAASKIRIRGATSLTQDNNPIIYIDGIRVSNDTGAGPGAIDFGDGSTISRLDDINPADIESIQVFKGPSAAAAYGTEAATGVIQITTKKGIQGDTQFRASINVGVTQQRYGPFEPNYFNLTENGGFTDPGDPAIQQFNPTQNPVTGDVFARMPSPLERYPIFRDGITTGGQVDMRGGSESVDYFGSLSYGTAEGVLYNNYGDDISIRANVSTRPFSILDIDFTSNYLERFVRTTGSGRSSLSNPVAGAVLGLPEFDYGVTQDGGRGDCLATFLFGEPESVCDLFRGALRAGYHKNVAIRNEQELGRFIGGVTVRFRPTDWLSSRLTTGIDRADSQDLNIVPLDPDRPFVERSRGEVDDFRHSDRLLSVDFATTADAQLAENVSSSTTIGAQYAEEKRETLGCSGRGGFAGPSAIACSASVRFDTSLGLNHVKELGGYLQERVGYNDYLFATGAVRLDDNSAFGDMVDPIVSPSVNVSLLLSDMPFWNIDAVTNLRLRGAWGKAAQAPGPHDAPRTFIPVRVDQGGTQVSGLFPYDPGNPDLKPERNEEWEAGFDAGLWDDRLGLQFSYYHQTITDAILARNVSPGTGFSQEMFVNIAGTKNEGFEGIITADVVRGDRFNWELELQFETENPEITDMGGIPPIIRSFTNMAGIFHEGLPPGAYYGPIYANAERDGNGAIIPASVEFIPGTLDFAGEFHYHGRPTPSNRQTLRSTLQIFDQLTVTALFNRQAGHHRMDELDASRNCFRPDRSGGELCAMREVILSPEDQACLEQDIADCAAIFVRKADFIAFRELSVRFPVPSNIFGAMGLESASMTVAARNLGLLTDWGNTFGGGPEADVSGGTDAFGHTGTYGTLGPQRTFNATLRVAF